MTQDIKDYCVVGCDAPTLQMVLARTLKDPLKRQYTCTKLYGVTSWVYRSWLIQTQLQTFILIRCYGRPQTKFNVA